MNIVKKHYTFILMLDSSNRVYSISQLNSSVRLLLQEQIGFVWLTGEISNFTKAYSGHWYFSLKDDLAQVKAAMFKGNNTATNFMPRDGMQVLVGAEISLYEPRGDYQVIVKELQLAGAGLLQQQFEQLKIQLRNEGLFDIANKKSMPRIPQTIGIITSQFGAALQDMLKILNRRDPSLSIIIYPSLVQGKEAVDSLITMLRLANARKECDVIILGRGGGSLEDLWCFNDESLARAIASSNIPIISAVGHETDVTISDFVADLRASTPSAAAEIVSRDQDELLRQLEYKQESLIMALDKYFMLLQYKLNNLIFNLEKQNPKDKLQLQIAKIQQLEYRLINTIADIISQNKLKINYIAKELKEKNLKTILEPYKKKQLILHQQLTHVAYNSFKQFQQHFMLLTAKLDSLSPLKVLTRGYSISVNLVTKKVISSIKEVEIKDQISIEFKDGKIISTVDNKV